MQCLEYSVSVSHDDSGSGEDDGEDGENIEEQRKKKRKFYDLGINFACYKNISPSRINTYY